MWRAAWRSLRQHKLRLVLSAVAIILGVGFVVGTFMFTDTLNKTFTDLFGQTTSDVVVTPEQNIDTESTAGATATLPSHVLKQVRSVDGVAKAGGQVFVDGVTIIGSDGDPLGTQGAPAFGSNWESDEQLTPLRLVEGQGPAHAGEVAIDSQSAEKAGFSVGDTVSVITPQGEQQDTVTGIFRFGTSGNLAGATITAFDTSTAQKVLLNGKAAYTEIDAIATEGVTQQELADRVSSAIGSSDITVKTGQQSVDDQTKQITEMLSFINIFLLTFALIALFVGIFIIINTFSMLVAQRARELALLRALGATARQVRLSVVAEAFIVGLVGSIIGIAVGILVSIGLQGLFNAVGASIPTGNLVIKPRTIIIGLVAGIGVTVAASLIPAYRASRIPPMAALREDVSLPSRTLRVRAIIGIVMVAIGVMVMAGGVSSGGGSGAGLVGLGTLVTLVGAIVLSPAIAGPAVGAIGWVYPRIFGTVGRLALDNAKRQPRRTAATASALMIGLALVSALTVFAASAKASINQSIDEVIGAEFTVSNQAQRSFPTTVADTVAATDGVAVVSAIKFLPAEVDGSSTSLVGIDPATASDVINLDFVDGSMDKLSNDGIFVDSKTAESDDLSEGDEVEVALPTVGAKDYQIEGIYTPKGGFSGWVMSNEGIASAGLDLGDNQLYVKADDGADLDALHQSLDSALAAYPTVQVQSQAEYKQQITDAVNQLLAVMIMLLSLAILIAVLGIVNTLVLSVIERTREIGMLRAIGALRKQVRRLVVLEAMVIAVFGAVVGIVLGVVFATALQRTLVDQGIQVLAIPWGSMVVFLIIAAVVGVLAALWPAYRAGKLDVLKAITSE